MFVISLFSLNGFAEAASDTYFAVTTPSGTSLNATVVGEENITKRKSEADSSLQLP